MEQAMYYVNSIKTLISQFVGILILLAFSQMSFSQDQEGVLVFEFEGDQGTQSDQLSVMAAGTTANYTLRPSVITSRFGNGVQELPFKIGCFSIYGGGYATDCQITFNNITVTPYSGGHNHDDASRPAGTVDPMTNNTAGSTQADFKFTAPEISGYVTASGSGVGTINGVPMYFSGSTTFEVKISGLVELISSSDYQLVGSTSNHTKNHYGVPSLNASLQTVARAYRLQTGDLMRINDMSLLDGGLFDIYGSWAPSHYTHRFGNNTDIGFPSNHVNKRTLRSLAIQQGFAVLTEGNHFHFSL